MSDDVMIAAAAAAAPVVPAVPASVVPPVVAEVPKGAPAEPVVPPADSGEPAPFVYEPIADDPGLTMALQFVGKLGLAPEHPTMVAAMQGDFSFLEAHLAGLGAKAQGHEAILNLAKKSWERHVANETSAKEATREAVYGVVGGAEQWQAIAAWANENAEPAEQTQINAMFKAGGLQAKMAAEFLRNRFAEASGTVVEPRSAVGAPAATGSAVLTALSPEQYQKEMGVLVRQYGATGVGARPEYAALQARRAAYRG